jgi:hypothetical protein
MHRYACATARRRIRVRESANVNGIDYLEVAPDQTTLLVHFLHGLPGTPGGIPAAPALGVENVSIHGGVRVRGIVVVSVASAGDVLTVTVDFPGDVTGDFSTYTFQLRASPDEEVPPLGFDPELSRVDFSFKVDCPSELDCRVEHECPPELHDEPEIEYLAKDYESFRGLMLDRMAAIMPAWRERNPADVQVALVELLAYVGDHLSYFQDAVATEAYLGTALKRPSVRRHARLLDYRMHDGCNARAWVCFGVDAGSDWDGKEIDPGTPLLSRGPDESAMVEPEALVRLVAVEGPTVFETMTSVTLRSEHNRIRFHTWSEDGCCLPVGATRATLVNDPALALEPGDTLILEEVLGPSTGVEADAYPAHRQAVRLTEVGDPATDPVTGTAVLEVGWHEDDALRFPLCLSVVSDDGTDVTPDVSVARGNVVLADHGRSVRPEQLVPADVPETGRYRPRLDQAGVTFRAPLDPTSASSAERSDPQEALPEIRIEGSGARWAPRLDLLSSDRFDLGFVAEVESDGTARVRFGDGEHGRAPAKGATLEASCRVGTGASGNVGADVLTRVVLTGSGITAVRNPIPAAGGVDPEPMERVRLLAPHALQTQERAVTEADYASVAERNAAVQKAAATIRWTGSWYTAFVTVDRRGGRDVDEPFERDLEAHLDLYRMAGQDVEVAGPVPVPLDILLDVCVAPGYLAADVRRALLAELGSRVLPDGRRGFFHPDNFTFGQPVYLSRLYRAALDVTGVATVEARRFHRFAREAVGELEAGVLTPGRLEVVQCESDPSFPERGRLDLVVEGGR